jgi:hypothetical protein
MDGSDADPDGLAKAARVNNDHVAVGVDAGPGKDRPGSSAAAGQICRAFPTILQKEYTKQDADASAASA